MNTHVWDVAAAAGEASQRRLLPVRAHATDTQHD